MSEQDRQHLLFDGDIVLAKMNMKGGWTYALLPPVIQGGKKHFGWARVNAVIDGYEMHNVSLMPIKGGRLFLAVKAAIRKKIKKEAGDTVNIQLYGDRPPERVSEEDFHEALHDEPNALSNFNGMSKKEQRSWIDWIFAVRDDDVVVARMATAITDIAAGRAMKI